MIFQFIKDYNSKRWTIEVMCRVLNVSKSSYYRWFKEPVSKRKQNYEVAPNLLNRVFIHEEPVKACVSDLTYISCLDGFLYLTCVLDLFDCKLIGWSMSDNMSASKTVIPAIRMANRNRAFPKNMIFHSDRGSQYACKQTVNILKSLNAKQSMSRKGNCWD
ncbi:MAG TPA: IS3 family transposase, partial [Rikenellaceae bacterium]|nr:IS3 family transposase [Rikenellaceae bacterium]